MSTIKVASILGLALSAAACGGAPEGADAVAESGEAASIARADSTDRSASDACSAVCTEVVACCICKCYADLDGPFAYLCSVGCFVLDTVNIEDTEVVVTFADRAGGLAAPLSEALEVSRASGSVDLEVIGYVAERGAVAMPARVLDVRFHAVRARAIGEGRWASLGSGTRTADGRVVMSVALGGLAADDYVVRATLALDDGSTREAHAMLLVR